MAPSFNIDTNSYDAAIAGVALVLGLDIVVVAGRLYIKKMFKQKLDLNDWLVIPALVRRRHARYNFEAHFDSALEYWHGSVVIRRVPERRVIQSNRHTASRSAAERQDIFGVRNDQKSVLSAVK